MPISSTQLEAFSEVAKCRSFSKAAKILHITQSALSQRILNLEAELLTTLIIRDPAGLRLTPAGEELMRYSQVKDGLEQETLAKLSTTPNRLAGSIRIAGFSSVMRSVVMPALSELLVEHPHVNIELFSRELGELPQMLTRNEVDFIVTLNESSKQEIESHVVGMEENVLVTGSSIGQSNTSPLKERTDVYLDHDSEDNFTALFFESQKDSPKESQKKRSKAPFRRNYLDEIYSIIEGVKLGWGRAVVPRHLIKGDSAIKIVSGYEALRVPVMVQYFRQSYYPELHKLTVECLGRNMPKILGRS